MICNITNATPFLLKEVNETNDTNETALIKVFRFFNSLMNKDDTLVGLKHLYIDIVFKLKPDKINLMKSFFITIETLDFVKDFEYILDDNEGIIIVRGSLDEFSILSLVILGSIKDLQNISPEMNNKGIFVSIAEHYLQFCLDNGYNACKKSDIEIIQKYNEGFDHEIFDNISIHQTSQNDNATIHFIGIPLTKDILCIFERYKDVKFDFNEKDASFIISMSASNWDNFWLNAPQNLKDDFENTLKSDDKNK